jgi:L-fuculose-phosphate aldolase
VTETNIRAAIIEACLGMNALGLNQGTSGNISVRHGTMMLITPSGVPYARMRPEDLASMPIEVDDGTWHGSLKPSSEWRLHLDIMRSRPEAGAIVHCHPTYCTTLAIARKSIPSCHYMIVAFGGDDVRVAEYATYGTKELSLHTLRALEGRNACLMANHGMVVFGATLEKAMWLAVELETIARQYFDSLLIGGPVLLSDDEVAQAARKFADYGLREAPPAG